MEQYQEMIGYGASFFIVISFLIKNDVFKIRMLNLIGCLLFTCYGVLIESIPIIIPNAFLVFVQLYYLFIHKEKKD